MPFIAAPFIGLGKALFGGGDKKKTDPTDLKSQSEQTLLQSQQKAMGLADKLAPQAQGFLDTTRSTLNPVIDYWSRLLGGDRSSITSLLSPELTRIGEGYNTARRTLFSLAPRGGGTSSLMAELPFAQQRDVSNLFATARPTAASNLLDVSRTTGALGTGLFDSTLSALSGSQRGASSALDALLQRRQQNIGIGEAVGKGIFSIVKLIAGGGDSGGGG